MAPKKPTPPRRDEKKRYSRPVLKVHGNLRTLTATKGLDKADGGGKPNTRDNGPQA
jgi:hypothetical protein